MQRYAHAGAPSAMFRGAQALAAGRLVEGVSIMTWAFANEPASATQALGAVAVAGTGSDPAAGDRAAASRRAWPG